ncbi:hypothetical protein [Polaromonas sp. JS666]|uniref:hypothetical protein n=1 Tax=Polaromonas sp. (strain JS666 / ATCC BAA-500) TaxID=296591 RepID=UPI00088C5E3D|nr:hypothetical protein [Polaromonas sp. JS666]SDN51682.1 hypothetical protein SAMN05720382_105310 [Polaromonas sp. JS666]
MTEPKNTGQFGKGNPGKPKGAVSKTTKTAKEAIALAAEGLGGTERLIAWAQEDPLNERAFWSSIYPKLLPLQVANADGEDFKTVTRIELVAMRARDSSQD